MKKYINLKTKKVRFNRKETKLLTSAFEKGETYNEREFVGILRKTIRQIREHRGYFQGSSVRYSQSGYRERSERSAANDG